MIILLPLAGMMLVFYSLFMLWRDLRGGDKKRILERLREEDVLRHSKKLEQSIRKQSQSEQAAFSSILNQISLTKKVERWIEQANLNWYATSFLLKIFVSAGVVAGGGLILKFSPWYVFGIAAMIAYLPLFVLKFLARRRMKKLVNQLPDVFELISQALRAGHSLASGVQLIGKQIADPAGTEFARIFHEQNLGIKIEEAFQSFANRTDQLDIRFFVTAVLIQRQTGGDLAEILDKNR
jgi:tight adherence protein B